MTPEAPMPNLTASSPAAPPWWKFPMVWLVVAGPAVVVLASIVTTVLAVQGADPVIRPAAPAADSGSRDAGIPAGAARNHVATPAR